MISMCYKLGLGNDLRVFYKCYGFGVERSKVKVTGSVSAFLTILFGEYSKTNDPKVFELGIGYHRNDVVLGFQLR